MTPVFIDRAYFAVACLAILIIHLFGCGLWSIIELVLVLHVLDFLYRGGNRILREFRGEWVLGTPFTSTHSVARRRPVVLITGGALGLGKALALEYVTRGYSVILWDINPAALEATKAELGKKNVDCSVQTAVVDVSNESAVSDAAKQLPEIDLLILNAGVVVGKLIADSTARDVEKVFSVNVFQLFHAGRHIVPKMVRSGAPERRVVVIGSIAGFKGFAYVADYNGSKAAANVFAEALTAELLHTNVGVTLVCPYVIDTGMFHGITAPRFFPMLTVRTVVDAVINAVEWKKRQVVIPWPVYWVNAIRLWLPSPAVDLMDYVLGGSTAMRTFTGSTSNSGSPKT